MNNDQRIIEELGKLKREVERLKRVEYPKGTSAWQTFDDITITGWAAGGTAILDT